MEGGIPRQPGDAEREPAEYDLIVSGRTASAFCRPPEDVMVEGPADWTDDLGYY